jgi:membrane protease YdiL (CAAX protease family)
MKSYQRLMIIILASLLISCVLCPPVFYLIQYLRSLSTGLQNALDFPFDRVMRRVILVVSILVLYRERKRLDIKSLASMGLARRRGWKSLLIRGWILGFCSLAIMLLVMMMIGSRFVECDFSGPWDFIFQLAHAFLTGAVVALIEEVFFRGFILQSLLKDLRAGVAVFWTSVFFAIVHFFNAADLPNPGWLAPFYGFKAVAYFFQPLRTPSEWIPGFIGLFLVGVVLAYACLWTRSLYLAIGLHAGWVFTIKAEGIFLVRLKSFYPWFFGGGEIVTGVFGWIMLLFMLAILRYFIPREDTPLT